MDKIMKPMTEKELREINPEEFEGKDIAWSNGKNFYGAPFAFTGRVLFDYDQGLSILNKEDSEDCLTGIHGPSYKGDSNYSSKNDYHKKLAASFEMLNGNAYDAQKWLVDLGLERGFGGTTCSFT